MGRSRCSAGRGRSAAGRRTLSCCRHAAPSRRTRITVPCRRTRPPPPPTPARRTRSRLAVSLSSAAPRLIVVCPPPPPSALACRPARQSCRPARLSFHTARHSSLSSRSSRRSLRRPPAVPPRTLVIATAADRCDGRRSSRTARWSSRPGSLNPDAAAPRLIVVSPITSRPCLSPTSPTVGLAHRWPRRSPTLSSRSSRPLARRLAAGLVGVVRPRRASPHPSSRLPSPASSVSVVVDRFLFTMIDRLIDNRRARAARLRDTNSHGCRLFVSIIRRRSRQWTSPKLLVHRQPGSPFPAGSRFIDTSISMKREAERTRAASTPAADLDDGVGWQGRQRRRRDRAVLGSRSSPWCAMTGMSIMLRYRAGRGWGLLFCVRFVGQITHCTLDTNYSTK